MNFSEKAEDEGSIFSILWDYTHPIRPVPLTFGRIGLSVKMIKPL
jgi:hypothetical protein